MGAKKKIRAVSTIEYAVLCVLIITGLIVMRRPILRVMMGRWKMVGDSFGTGQQLDPTKTLECGLYAPVDDGSVGPITWGQPIWYEQRCYQCCMDEYTPDCLTFNIQPNLLTTCRNKKKNESLQEAKECCAQACESAECAP